MALLQVWLPALVVGHLVALVLLVYGAGFGVRSVTRCWKVKHKGDGLPRTTSCPDPSEAGCDQAGPTNPARVVFEVTDLPRRGYSALCYV